MAVSILPWDTDTGLLDPLHGAQPQACLCPHLPLSHLLAVGPIWTQFTVSSHLFVSGGLCSSGLTTSTWGLQDLLLDGRAMWSDV
jgi:hypothetical protein